MKLRRLGKTGLQVSEIGFGAEWLERHPEEDGIDLIHYASAQGINILDCWMPDPKSRDIIGKGIKDNRSQWYIQGHLGSTWKDEQYFRTRDMTYVRPAFEDLLARLQTDYIDLGMIHYVDSEQEWEQLQHSDYLDYVMSLKNSGVIRHIGMSSHNPKVAMKAAQSGYVEMILFSINPAFDMLPASENIDTMFAEEFDAGLKGTAPDRTKLYRTCEENDVGITVMKGFAGGRLFDEKRSPFGVRLSPVQCIHYALTRPAVSAILCGYDTSSSLILKFYFWIEMRKLNSSVVSRKMPRNTFLCEISFLRPSRKNLVQVLNRWNTDIQKALNSKRGQLNFSHIQP